ncbi:hypothetical protein K445DRAFT_369569 [Daldinia sp. EC12]|nr:hypothetical protein K445DRAFT_369569 [Daldinia sp. EC12]
MSNNTNSKPTCLSSEEHDANITDHLLHYFGCITLKDREVFFKEDFSIWKNEFQHQQETLHHSPDQAKRITDQKRTSWKANCTREVDRIDLLRQELLKDEKGRHLVNNVAKSHSDWRKWRESLGSRESLKPLKFNWLSDETNCRKTKETTKTEYILEDDIIVPIIQFDDGKSDSIKSDEVRNKFPNQKTTVQDLLSGKDNLLHKRMYSREPSSGRLVRYFHIPSNNMDWIEQAIGRYFGGDMPNPYETDSELKRKKKTKAHMILRDEYWRGQLHGGQPNCPAHGRYMKPLCTTMSSDPEDVNSLHRNMVLFMPFLHWDTSRKNKQFAKEIKEIMDSAREAGKTTQSNGESTNPKLALPVPKQQKPHTKWSSLKLRWPTVQDRSIEKYPTVDKNGRIKVDKYLGQFLLDAARLYEGISNYRDKILLRHYLTKNPPLHPRRTLDQAYHWTIDSTWERDQDQVIYRHTTTKPKSFHKYDLETGKCKEHEEFNIEGNCEKCKRDIQNESRILMVDQLWMWILDADTIITCFSKRYGSNKQDISAVHKSIRIRMQDSSPDQVRTAFDLGLIIIDECINTLFDQIKTAGRQPHVIEAFTKAIRIATHQQTIAFKRLWRWTEEAGDIYKANGKKDIYGHQIALLDIHPEGRLEKEIKDIIEELDILIHITKVHMKMISAFIANAESLLDPCGKFGDSRKREMMSHYILEMIKKDSSERSEETRKILEEHGSSVGRNEQGDGVSESYKKKHDDYNWFKLNADELEKKVRGRIEELEELHKNASDTAQSIKDLLDLKQQQASVVQAWQSIQQSEETVKQGRSIMVFTVVTILFLPLSFMSSIFGMNNTEITSDTWSIEREFLYMFTISTAVIIVSLFLAFNDWSRAILFWMGIRLWMAIVPCIVRSGLYDWWPHENWSTKGIYLKANTFTDRRKEEAREILIKRKFGNSDSTSPNGQGLRFPMWRFRGRHHGEDKSEGGSTLFSNV